MTAIDLKQIILDAIYKNGIITKDEYIKISEKLTIDYDTEAEYNVCK
jgi:uncharacterized protein YqgQ